MNFDVTAPFSQQLNTAQLFQIIRWEYVTSKFISHSQEVHVHVHVLVHVHVHVHVHV